MKRFLQFIGRIFQEFGHDNCMIRSASLTFISLIAVVPLSVVILSLFSLFGAVEPLFMNLQSYLFTNSFPTMHQEIVANLDRLIDNASSIGLAGALFFIIPSILLVNNINSNFNAVWGSRSRGPALEKILTYSSVILAGTALILAGFTFSYILRITSGFIESKGNSFFGVLIIHVVPRIFTFLTFLLLIMLIPGGKVRLLSGLVGALTGLICWEIAKVLFVFGTTSLLRMSDVYGSLAAVPLFLIWLYTAWGIVLYALEAAFVYQHRGKKWIGKSHERLMPAGQLYIACKVFFYIASAYQRRGTPPSRRNLSEALYLTETELDFITGLFIDAGLLKELGALYPRYFPSRKPELITASDVVFAAAGNLDSLKDPALDPKVEHVLQKFFSGGTDLLKQPVSYYLSSDPPPFLDDPS